MSNRFKKISSTLIAFAVAVSAMMFVSMWKTNAYADSDEEVYALMNIPYDEFYKAELETGSPKVDAVASPTMQKTRMGLAAGSYHVNEDGSDITGVVYPVKVKKSELTGLKEVTDATSVSVTTENHGNKTTTEYKGKDALFEQPSYSYYLLKTVPSYFKDAAVESGKWSFGKARGEEKKVSGISTDISAPGRHTKIEVRLNDPSKVIKTGLKVNAGVVKTTDGKTYGMRHVVNLWRGVEIGWLSSRKAGADDPYDNMLLRELEGKTIAEVKYFTEDGTYLLTFDKALKIPELSNGKFTVDSAKASDGKSKGIFENLEAEYDPEFASESLKDARFERKGNVVDITYPRTSMPGMYTIVVTDKKGRYNKLFGSLVLTTDVQPVKYSADAKKPALLRADGATDEEFKNYIKNITGVVVDGKNYSAGGKNAVVTVKSDGSIDVFADSLAKAGKYDVTVRSTGYPDLVFNYDASTARRAALEALKTGKEELEKKLKDAEKVKADLERAQKELAAEKQAGDVKTIKAELEKVRKELAEANKIVVASRGMAVQLTKLKLNRIKTSKKKASVSWKSSGEKLDGYILYKSLKKTGGFKIAGRTTAMKVAVKKGLKKGRKAYFKVRGYKVVDGKRVYTGFSSVKAAKIR